MEDAQVEAAEHRLEAGPQSGEYEHGSPSEYYTPTAIATPVTPFGEPADIFSHEVLVDSEDTDS
jgi:hypothetical protein